MTNEELMASIDAGNRTLISAHTIGKTNTAVLTFEGVYPPRFIALYRAQTRVYPYRPRSIICEICFEIGHKTEVCPVKKSILLCRTCCTPLPVNDPEALHDCTAHCKNCNGSHSPLDPSCPARIQADANYNKALLTRQRNAQNRTDRERRGIHFNSTTQVHTPRQPLQRSTQDPSHRGHQARSTSKPRSVSRPRLRPSQQRNHQEQDQIQPQNRETPQGSSKSYTQRCPKPTGQEWQNQELTWPYLPSREVSDRFPPNLPTQAITMASQQGMTYKVALETARRYPTTQNRAQAIALGIQQRNNKKDSIEPQITRIEPLVPPSSPGVTQNTPEEMQTTTEDGTTTSSVTEPPYVYVSRTHTHSLRAPD